MLGVGVAAIGLRLNNHDVLGKSKAMVEDNAKTFDRWLTWDVIVENGENPVCLVSLSINMKGPLCEPLLENGLFSGTMWRDEDLSI